MHCKICYGNSHLLLGEFRLCMATCVWLYAAQRISRVNLDCLSLTKRWDHVTRYFLLKWNDYHFQLHVHRSAHIFNYSGGRRCFLRLKRWREDTGSKLQSPRDRLRQKTPATMLFRSTTRPNPTLTGSGWNFKPDGVANRKSNSELWLPYRSCAEILVNSTFNLIHAYKCHELTSL